MYFVNCSMSGCARVSQAPLGWKYVVRHNLYVCKECLDFNEEISKDKILKVKQYRKLKMDKKIKKIEKTVKKDAKKEVKQVKGLLKADKKQDKKMEKCEMEEKMMKKGKK